MQRKKTVLVNVCGLLIYENIIIMEYWGEEVRGGGGGRGHKSICYDPLPDFKDKKDAQLQGKSGNAIYKN